MENLPIQNRLSSSTKQALDWAYTWSKARGVDYVESTDLLVGIIQSHGQKSPPLELLRHFKIPPENLYSSLGFSQDKLPQSQESFPGETVLDTETVKVIDRSLSLAEQYNAAEKGLVRLRDLFGGIVQEPTAAQSVLKATLSPLSISFDNLVEAYQEYLKVSDRTSLPGFMEDRFPDVELRQVPSPSIQLAVSGYSADTRADRDLVGIGAEVDAFAYLISARALQPPLAIGLFGDWGSGKTYFMQSLQERIHRITQDARESRNPQKDISIFKYIVQIEFNAWHYVEGELWASLVEHIFHNLQTRPGEEATLLQQRQQHWIDKLENLRRAQGAAQALKVELEEQRDEKREQIKQLEEERQQRLEELNNLKAKDVISAISLSPEDQARFNQILESLGMDGAYRSALDFMDVLTRMQATLERGNALTLVFRQRGLRWTLGLILVILSGPAISAILTILSRNQIPEVTNALVSLSGFLGGLTVLLKQSTAKLSAMIDKVERARAELDARRQQVEEEYTRQIVDQERELANATAAYEQALVEEQNLIRQIEVLEQELQQITPRRVLLDFIRDRVGSEDYRKRLGVAALIRRDFDQLWQLIRDQNQDYIDKDDGVEREENRHLINRIVLFIDDLDRCPPDRVVQVLQAVHLLLAFPLFVVVVAVDARWLSQSLQKHYEGLLTSGRLRDNQRSLETSMPQATPKDYLEKIFQIPFWVRPLPESARKRIVQGMVEKSLIHDEDESQSVKDADLEGQEEKQETLSRVRWQKDELLREFKKDLKTDPNPPSLDILEDELKFMEELRSLLGLTPRSVKRFVNVYWLMKSIALSQTASFITGTPHADFKQVLFLLAVLTGLPAISSEFVNLLREGELVRRQAERNGGQKISGAANPTLKDIIEALHGMLQHRSSLGEEIDDASRELKRLESWVSSYDNGSWSEIPVSALGIWAPLAARFSYRMEEI